MSDQFINCDKDMIIHQLLRMQAQVTITPITEHGDPHIYCVDSEILPDCNCAEKRNYCQENRVMEKSGKCTFTVTQLLCIEIPFSIDVDVDVDQGVLCCGKPDFGPCCIQPCKEPDGINKNKK